MMCRNKPHLGRASIILFGDVCNILLEEDVGEKQIKIGDIYRDMNEKDVKRVHIAKNSDCKGGGQQKPYIKSVFK